MGKPRRLSADGGDLAGLSFQRHPRDAAVAPDSFSQTETGALMLFTATDEAELGVAVVKPVAEVKYVYETDALRFTVTLPAAPNWNAIRKR